MNGQEMNHHLDLRFDAAPQVPSQAGVPRFHLRDYRLPRSVRPGSAASAGHITQGKEGKTLKGPFNMSYSIPQVLIY